MLKSLTSTYNDMVDSVANWWEDNWRIIAAIISIPLILLLGILFANWFFYGV